MGGRLRGSCSFAAASARAGSWPWRSGYSEFNSTTASIAAMDAEVITIEPSRSDMERLDGLDHYLPATIRDKIAY